MNKAGIITFLSALALAILVFGNLYSYVERASRSKKVIINHILLHSDHAGFIPFNELEYMAPLHSYSCDDAIVFLEYYDIDEPQDKYIAHVLTPHNGWEHIITLDVESMFYKIRRVIRPKEYKE